MVPTKGPCPLVSTRGTSTATCGKPYPHRDCMISANPGGGAFHLWVGAGDVLAIWVVVMGFDLPTLWAAVKEPQAWALLFSLWLCSWDMVGSVGLDVLEDVIFTQCEGTSLPKTSMSVNIVNSSMASLSSHTHSTNWHGLPGIGGWASQPNVVMPWHTPGFSVVVSCSSLGC